MSSTNLEKVIEEVRALAPEEQRQVRDLIDSLLVDSATPSPEDLLNQRLLASGLIRRIPPRVVTSESPVRFKPIEVKGEPVSETIIRERR